MILGIEKEWSVFWQAMLSGNIVYLAYCVIRVLRRLIKHNLFFVSLEDIFYWLGVGIYLFIRVYQTNNGTIRWYFILGTILGAIFTHYIIQRIVKKYVAKRKKR